MRLFLALPVALALILAFGSPAAAQSPGLTVSQPASQAVISGGAITIQFEVSEFRLVPTQVPLDEAGKRPDANRPGEGHLHFMLDLQPVVVWEKAEPYTFTNVPPGEHRLMVEVVNNDHSPLSPPVMQTIQLTVTPSNMPRTGEGGSGTQVASAGALHGLIMVEWAFLALVAMRALRRRSVCSGCHE